MTDTHGEARVEGFGALLRRHRLAAGLSQTELAERAGISWRAVTDLERGASQTPHRDTVQRLVDALALPPAERTALEAAIVRRRGPRDPVAIAPASAPDAGPRDRALPAQEGPAAPPLPAQLTPFVGRRRDLEAVLGMLRGTAWGASAQAAPARLLTLRGPAGIGKTRLALRVAQALQDDGVPALFVPLATVGDPELVLPAIVQTLRLQEVPGQSLLNLLAQHLRHAHAVLLLDNLEQVVAAGPEIGALLERCEKLQVLVTSRAVLHLYGEYVYDVPPLSLPDDAATPALAPDHALQSEAVQLFVQRAQAVNPAFALTAETAPAVAELCQALQGLPLAIELAAARTRLFSVPALRAQLGHRLDLLVGGPRDRPPRQQSLRQAIAWSYDLLDDGEKVLFACLAVFSGEWTLEAAAALCGAAGSAGAAGLSPATVTEGLTSLVDKSLVQAVRNGSGEARFTMLELIREYATTCLIAGGQAERLHREHAAYFAAYAEELAPRLLGPEQVRWLAHLEQDNDNIRAALAWTRAHGEITLGLRLARAVCSFWDMRSRLNEGRHWLEALLAVVDGDESRERQELRAFALRRAGLFASRQGDYGHARAFYEDSLTLCRALGDRTGTAATLNNLGILALDGADFERAQSLFEESLALRRELGTPLGLAQVLNNLGEVARARGHFEQARAYYEETLVLAQESGQEWGMAIGYLNLGSVACEQGDYPRAARAYAEGLARLRALGDARVAAEGLEGMARIAAALGRLSRAARLYGAAAAQRESVGAPLPPYERLANDRRIAGVRAALGEASFTRAWAAGQQLDLHGAVALALAADQ